MNKTALLSFLIFNLFFVNAQETAKLVGVVNNELETPIKDANINVVGENVGTISNFRGEFELVVPAGEKITLKISNVGYSTKKVTFTLQENEVKKVNIKLDYISFNDVTIYGQNLEMGFFRKVGKSIKTK